MFKHEKTMKLNDCELTICTDHGMRYIGIFPGDSVIISKIPLSALNGDVTDSEYDELLKLMDMYDLSDGQPYYKDHSDKKLVAIIDAVLNS